MRSLCTFEVAGQRFGLDAARVQEVVRVDRLTPVPRAAPDVVGLLNLRGLIVLAVDAAARLGLDATPGSTGVHAGPPATTAPATTQPLAVVLAAPEGAVALLVPDVYEIMRTDTACFVPPERTREDPAAPLLQGAYRTADHLTVVLDADQVVRSGIDSAPL